MQNNSAALGSVWIWQSPAWLPLFLLLFIRVLQNDNCIFDSWLHNHLVSWSWFGFSNVFSEFKTNACIFLHLQDSLKEPSDSSESDSSLSQSPNMQDWLAQARSTRSLQHQDTLQKQKVKNQNNGSRTITIVSSTGSEPVSLLWGVFNKKASAKWGVIILFIQELEEQLAEQKKLLKSVASRGEEILTQQASPVRAR